ncbi:MAG: histidine kinase [Chloroflexus sp.]|uniref:GAF domain-containing protein n=1 Tax=Chloroflexus sp. TaxID=1904827 RepID=UPI0021DDBE25|nr:GAF domain-containing protein [Chloroflexus sp.]GIV89293.1 MAG: histidine kinase [Chloroflexus sp.]
MSGISSDQMNRALPLGDLLAFDDALRADDTPESLLGEVVETLRRIVNSPCVYVRLRDTERDLLHAVAFAGIAPELVEQLRVTPIGPDVYQPLLRDAYRQSSSFLVPAEALPVGVPDTAAVAPSAALLTPLRGRGDRLIGVIVIAWPVPPDPATVRMVEAVARQAALAVENVRLAERSARLLAKEQLLAELGRAVGATLDLDTILRQTVDRLAAAFGSGLVALLDDEGELLVAAAASPLTELIGRRLPLADKALAWVVQNGRPFVIEDCRSPEGAQSIFPPDVMSCVIAPLRSGGRVIGLLSVVSRRVGAFNDEDVDLLEAIAAQVSGPIVSAQLYAESQRLARQVQRRADQLAVLNSIARIVTATLDLHESLPLATQQIQQGFGYPQVDLFLLDEDASELVLVASAGQYAPARVGHRQHINLGLVGRAARSGKIVRAEDVAAEADYLGLRERLDIRSELCVPLIANGKTLGVLNIESPQPAGLTAEDAAVLETVADMLAGAVENGRLYQRAQQAAALEERNRLARELHDSVSQQLFSMTLTAQAARSQFERNPARVPVLLERLHETATAALAEMRALIFQLRPPALRDQGLVAAIQQHAQHLAHREGLRIELNVIGDERHVRGIEQPLFRIVQEALNNIVKHAAARNVRIQLELTVDQARLCVADDGQGFDPKAYPSGEGRHLGLLGMRERAAELGGSFTVRSHPGSGTEIEVIVPLRERHAAGE